MTKLFIYPKIRNCFDKKFLLPFVVIFICIVLSILAHSIPQNKINENVLKSKSFSFMENLYRDKYGFTVDNYTDTLMLLLAYDDTSDSAIHKAFNNSLASVASVPNTYSDPFLALRNLPWQQYIYPYPRYWHGYLSIVTPLLYMFSYTEIRTINLVMQLLLLKLVLSALKRKKKYAAIMPYTICYLFLIPPVLWDNLTYSMMFYVYSLASYYLILYHNKIKQHLGYPVFFSIIGIITNYMDFLTYPILTLIIPLALLLYIEPITKMKKLIKMMFILPLCWGVSYVGMMAVKWGISSAVMKQNIFADALEAIHHRTSSYENNGEDSRLAYLAVWDIFMNSAFLYKMIVGYLVIMVALCMLTIKAKWQYLKKNYVQVLGFCGLALFPFIWSLVFTNHIGEHRTFTFRIIAGQFFPLLLLVTIFAFQGIPELMSKIYCYSVKNWIKKIFTLALMKKLFYKFCSLTFLGETL